MNRRKRLVFIRTPLAAALGLLAGVVLTAGSASATIQYLADGAVPNANGWALPPQGTCPADLTQATRPDCLALRLNIVQASCTTPYAWTTSGVCNDTVNNSQVLCEAQEDRKWNAAPTGTDTCAIVMKGDDRNNVVCALHGGTWTTAGTCTGSWTMPARTAYTPPLLTGTGPGDQCLRCHNAVTQYNGPRVRDVDETRSMGHKNMSRKVVAGQSWGGPPFSCTVGLWNNEHACEMAGGQWRPTGPYPTNDAGNAIDWVNGTIDIAGTDYEMLWIYGDWLAPLPRVLYKAPASTSTVCDDPRYTTSTCVANGGTLIKNAGAAYSCSRCHTTGATSDATINGGVGIEGKEPEASFPGITWDRLSDAPANVVNLSWGVKDDPNRYASWDVFGIVCSRCHGSAIDTTKGDAQTPTQYSSPTGMSSHQNNIVAFDISSGACSDPNWTAEAQCTAAGGSWLTACSVNPTAGVCTMAANTEAKCTTVSGTWTASGFCSVAYYDNQADCLANSPSAGSANTWTVGFCSNADVEASCSGGAGDAAETWRRNGTQQSCVIAGAAWSLPWCSVPGVCNTRNPAHNSKALCEAASGQWITATDLVRCVDIHQYGKDNDIAEYEAARWTGNKANRGQTITRLCMDCHRQETSGLPYLEASANPGTYDTTNPGMYLKVGPAHGSVAPVSHPHGNMFLNSPHGQFTGTFNQIALGKHEYNGSGLYKSFFQREGEAANTGNGCTGCHDPHVSTVPSVGDEAIHEECTECHAKDLTKILHPSGGGTPLEEMATKPAEACVTCHMPHGLHMFRINSDAAYSTYPAAALTATVNANTAADGAFTNAVWVDLDGACGQCHGGGTAQATATGSVAAGSKVLTVDDNAGFVAGGRVVIPAAGALEEDGATREDFETYVVSVAGSTTINLAGAVSGAVTDAEVVQNPTKNGAGYMDKTELAKKAKGIHNDAPYASFGYTLGASNTLMVNVNAGASTCSGSAANCDHYDWDWGDGTAHGSGVTASHTYATGGAKVITLTVEQYGVGEASAQKIVTVVAPDLSPAVDGTCSFDANTWIETVTDTSTDDGALKQVTVNWGDGTILSNDTSAPFGPFTHTYARPGTFTLTHKAVDTTGQQSTKTCTATPAYFSISGTVKNKLGTANLPSATVTVKKAATGTVVKTVYTAANGTFSAGSLKPGSYTLTVTKVGYTFAVPAATITVGPSSAGNTINATAP